MGAHAYNGFRIQRGAVSVEVPELEDCPHRADLRHAQSIFGAYGIQVAEQSLSQRRLVARLVQQLVKAVGRDRRMIIEMIRMTLELIRLRGFRAAGLLTRMEARHCVSMVRGGLV